MTTILTYWDRSPQESSQSAEDCTLDRCKKETPYKEGIPFMHPSTLRYLQQSLTWHGVSSQASHTLTGLLQQPPTSQFCLQNQIRINKILAQHSTEGNSPTIKPYVTRKTRQNILHDEVILIKIFYIPRKASANKMF